MAGASPVDVLSIERPHPRLMTYYTLTTLLTGPLFFILIVPAYFRYHTMHYRFDDEGVHMRWGILFRREINLTYSRIQDIHLVSNLVERWLGLGRVQIQTASGSAKAELTIEGILEFEAVRGFLYSKMRGPREAREPGAGRPHAAEAADAGELAATLRDVAAEIRALREAVDRWRGPAGA